MRKTHLHFLTGLILCFLTFIFGANALAGICCLCHPGNAQKTNICLLTDAKSCAALPQGVSNQHISDFTCQGATLSDAQCQTTAKKGVCTTVAGAADYGGPADAAISNATPLVVPKLGVDIPGLTFSNQPLLKDGKIAIPFLAQYISAMYRLLIGFATVAAAVMLVWGGFKYMLNPISGQIQYKDTIQNAIIGLILVLGTYVILANVNPATTGLKPLEVTFVTRDPYGDLLAANGTAEPETGTAALERMFEESGHGYLLPGAPTPPPVEALQESEKIDVSSIAYDTALGGPANISKYCSTPEQAAAATTYQEKMKLLAKAIMGIYNVCVKNSKCVYSAGTNTQSDGTISAAPFPDGALNFMVGHKIQNAMPEVIWPNDPDCVDAWYRRGDYDRNKKNSYAPAAAKKRECITNEKDRILNMYQEYVKIPMEQAKVYASDCGTLVFLAYTCAGFVDQKKIQPPFEQTKGQINSYYYGPNALHQFDDNPRMILAAHMNQELESLAAPKGGFKFGDWVYTCCGGPEGQNNAHWYLYTGGRPDVPFSFIEMGGKDNGTNVPGVGHVGGVGVKIGSIQDDVGAKTSPRHAFYDQPGVFSLPPSYNLNTGLIFVWRPLGEIPTPEPAPATP